MVITEEPSLEEDILIAGKNRYGRYWYYFRRGHGVWLSIIFWAGSTVGIWYRLLEFDAIFATVFDFAIVMIPLYIICATMIGWRDIMSKRGTYSVEARISLEQNPAWQKHVKRINNIEQKLERILNHLERITEVITK